MNVVTINWQIYDRIPWDEDLPVVRVKRVDRRWVLVTEWEVVR
jgi:hypothetical protein